MQNWYDIKQAASLVKCNEATIRRLLKRLSESERATYVKTERNNKIFVSSDLLKLHFEFEPQPPPSAGAGSTEPQSIVQDDSNDLLILAYTNQIQDLKQQVQQAHTDKAEIQERLKELTHLLANATHQNNLLSAGLYQAENEPQNSIPTGVLLFAIIVLFVLFLLYIRA